MPRYEVELSDGRVVELEADREPTHDEVFSALRSYSPPAPQFDPVPEPLGPPTPYLGYQGVQSTPSLGPLALPQQPQPQPLPPASDFIKPQPPTDMAAIRGTPQPGFTDLGALAARISEGGQESFLDAARDIPSGANVQLTPFERKLMNVVPGGERFAEHVPMAISSGAKVAAGIADYFTTGKGLGEFAVSKTPAAPLVYLKWFYDMAKGGAQSLSDFRDAMDAMVEAHATGASPEEINEIKQMAWDHAVSALAMFPGSTMALRHGGQRTRALLPERMRQGEKTGRIIYQKPSEPEPQQLGLPRVISHLKDIFGTARGLPRPVEERLPPPPIVPPTLTPQPHGAAQGKDPSASQVTEAGQLHAVVPPPAVKGQTTLPIEGGGQRVRTFAEEEARKVPVKPVWQGGAAPPARRPLDVDLQEKITARQATIDNEDLLIQEAEAYGMSVPEFKEFLTEENKRDASTLRQLKAASKGVPPSKLAELQELVRKYASTKEYFDMAELPNEKALGAKKLAELEKKIKEFGGGKQGELIADPVERQLIETQKELDRDIEVVPDPIDEPPVGPREGDPFARKRGARPKPFMKASRLRQTIQVYPEAMKKWLATIAPEKRAAALQARLWEERFHLAVPDTSAGTYWNTLTAAEKMIEERIYTGHHGKKARQITGYGTAAHLWGQEAIRRRMQQLYEMEESEIAEASGLERWSLKGLSVLGTAIRGIRETMGTAASQEGLRILSKIQGNLEVAKAAVQQRQQGEDPKAFAKFRDAEKDEYVTKGKLINLTGRGAKLSDGRWYDSPEQGEMFSYDDIKTREITDPAQIDYLEKQAGHQLLENEYADYWRDVTHKNIEARDKLVDQMETLYWADKPPFKGLGTRWVDAQNKFKRGPVEKDTQPNMNEIINRALDQLRNEEMAVLNRQPKPEPPEHFGEVENWILKKIREDYPEMADYVKENAFEIWENNRTSLARNQPRLQAAVASVFGKKIPPPPQLPSPSLYNFGDRLRKEFYFKKLLEEGFDHERARDIFRLWEGDSDVQQEVGDVNPVLAEAIDNAIRRGKVEHTPYAFNRRSGREPWEEPDFVPVDVYAEAVKRSKYIGTGEATQPLFPNMPKEWIDANPQDKLLREFVKDNEYYQSAIEEIGHHLYTLEERSQIMGVGKYREPYTEMLNMWPESADFGVDTLKWMAGKEFAGKKGEWFNRHGDFIQSVFEEFTPEDASMRKQLEDFAQKKTGDFLDPDEVESVVTDWSAVRSRVWKENPDLGLFIEETLWQGYERPEAALEGPRQETKGGDLRGEDPAAFNRRQRKYKPPSLKHKEEKGDPFQERLFAQTGATGEASGEWNVPRGTSAEELGAMPRPNARQIFDPVRHTGKVLEHLEGTIGEGEGRYPRYTTFEKWAKQTGGLPTGAIQSIWSDAVWSHLLRASGKRLEDWRRALGLAGKITAKGLPRRGTLGDRTVPDAISMEEARQKTFKLDESSARAAREAALRAEADRLEELAKVAPSEPRKKAPAAIEEQLGFAEPGLGTSAPKKPKAKAVTIETKEQLLQRAKGLRARADIIKGGGEYKAERTAPEPVPMTQELATAKTKEAAFQARITARQQMEAGRKRTRADQRYRAKVIEAVADKLIRESAPPRGDLKRGDISMEDIDFKVREGEGPFVEISKAVAESPKVLHRILTDNARLSSTDTPSITRRLVALIDKQTNSIELSSVYEHGRQGLMVVDPMKAGGTRRPNIALDDILKRQYRPAGAEKTQQRYRPIYSVLLRDPVQNFHKHYPSIREFNEALRVGDALAMSRLGDLADYVQEGPTEARPIEGTEGLRGEGGSVVGPQAGITRANMGIGQLGEIGKALHTPITPGEARSVFNLFTKELGALDPLKAPEDIKEVLDTLAQRREGTLAGERRATGVSTFKDLMAEPARVQLRGADRNVLSAFLKLTDRLLARDPVIAGRRTQNELLGLEPGLTEQQAYDRAVRMFYDAASNVREAFGDTSPEFQANQFADQITRMFEATEGGGPREITGPRPTQPQPRELTMPEARRMPEFMRRRPQGVSEYGVGAREAPERFLSPEEQEYVRSQPLMGEGRLRATGEYEPGKPIRPTRRVPFATPSGLQVYREDPMAFPKTRRAWEATIERSKNIVQDTIKDPLKAYSGWMVDRLREGGPESRKAADVFNEIISKEKGFYGQLTKYLDKARRLAGGSTLEHPFMKETTTSYRGPSGPVTTKKRRPSWEQFKEFRKDLVDNQKAVKWLHGLKPVAGVPGAAQSHAMLAIEKQLRPPPYADKVVDAIEDANIATGHLYSLYNKDFKATGKWQRNLNATGYDIVRQGDTPLRRTWVKASSELNQKPENEVREFFDHWKGVLDQEVPDFADIERVNQDYVRLFPHAVTHLKMPTGQWEPIIHSDPFNYLEASARRATHVAAFRSFFPDTKKGRAAFQQMKDALIGHEVTLSEAYRNQQGKWVPAVKRMVPGELNPNQRDVFSALVKTLQGTPTDNYSRTGFMAPGKVFPEAFRFLNQTLGTAMSRAVLTGQMFLQPGEVLAGSTPLFLGYKNYWDALRELKDDYKATYAELEKNGAVNRVVYDWSWDPHNKIRSSFRLFGNALSKGSGQQLLNELQETAAAATARIVKERIIAHKLSPWEERNLPQTFKAMGFTPDQIASMMRGNTRLLDQFERKSAAFLTSGNKAMAEGSPLGANRLVNSIFRFQSYPMMKANQLRQVMGNWLDASKANYRIQNDPNSTPQQKELSRKQARVATEQMAYYVGGTALQGVLTAAITTLAYQGLFGVQEKAHEATDEPFEFMLEAFTAAMGGPFYILFKGAQQGDVSSIPEQAARTIFPWMVLQEFYALGSGSGPYRDKDLSEKIGTFIDRKVPGTKALGQGMAMLGLSNEDKKLETSLQAFYRWRRDEFDYKPGTPPEFEYNEEFRKHMRRAVEAMKSGDRQEFRKNVREALKLPKKEHQDIAASLRGRKVLQTPWGAKLTLKQKKSLRSRIGDAAYRRLEHYDRMLEAAAEQRWLQPRD